MDEDRKKQILTGSPLRSIIILGVPSMLTGLVQAVTPFADSLFIYNISGDTAGAAVTFAGPVINFLQAFGLGLGAAGLAVIGRSHGSGNRKRSFAVSVQFLKTSIISGCIAASFLAVFAGYATRPLDPSLSGTATAYLRLTAIGLPFMYFASAYNAIALGHGRAEKPFHRALLTLVLKISGDILFVMIMRQGVNGAAAATLFSSVLSSVFMVYDLRKMFSGQRMTNTTALLMKTTGMGSSKFFLTILMLGVPSALVQASTSLSFYFMNNEAARYGTDVLNGFGIANTINSIFFAPAAAIGSAVAAAAAITCGAKQYGRAKTLSREGIRIAIVSSIVFTAILFPLSEPLVSIFSRTVSVVSHASEAMRYFSASIIGFALFNVVAGAFSGIGKTTVPLWIAVIRVWILRVPVVLVLEALTPSLSEKIIWISMAVSNFGTAAVALIMLRHISWKHNTLSMFDFDGTTEEAP
jgi:putative MATE family efflux protein